MKIAFMAYDRPNYTGGPIVNARRLLPELCKRGHEVHSLLFYAEDCPSIQYLEIHGVICHSIKRPVYTEDQTQWILNKIIEIRPDIFVPNIFVSGFYASRWIRESGIPTIAAYRSDDPFHTAVVKEFVLGNPEWAVSGLVCVSNDLLKRVEAYNPKYTKLCFIPSGVPTPEYLADQNEQIKIAYVGRLEQQQKNIKNTLEALIRIIKKYPVINAAFFGDGSERRYLENVVKQQRLESNIKFYGMIPPELLQNYLAEYNVLVLLSDYEGTPGAVMDAMACGLIPVAKNIKGGVQELIKHEQTGLLINDMYDDLDSAITRLYNDIQLRINLSKAARKHIEDNYSLDKTTTRWENFLAELIEDSNGCENLQYPHNIVLPVVRDDLAREDHRKPKLLKRSYIELKRLIRNCCSRIYLK